MRALNLPRSCRGGVNRNSQVVVSLRWSSLFFVEAIADVIDVELDLFAQLGQCGSTVLRAW